MTLNTQLRQLESSLARYPLPTSWIARQPHLAELGTFTAVLDALRYYANRELADRIVRSLLTLPASGRPAVEPSTVLLLGLTLRARNLHRGIPDESYTDLITELAALLCEPGLADQIHDRSNLCDLLTRRAGRRWQRRHHTQQRRAARQRLTDTHDFEYMTGGNDRTSFEETVVNRVALGAFRQRVDASVKSGNTSAAQWANYVQGVLVVALDLPGRTTPSARINLPRARHHLANHITQALAA